MENQISPDGSRRGWQGTRSYRFISVQLVAFVPVKQGSQLLKGPVDKGLRKYLHQLLEFTPQLPRDRFFRDILSSSTFRPILRPLEAPATIRSLIFPVPLKLIPSESLLCLPLQLPLPSKVNLLGYKLPISGAFANTPSVLPSKTMSI